MGFGEAYINVQLIIQRFFETPFYYDVKSDKLVANIKIKHRWKMPTWHLFIITAVSGLSYAIYRCGVLLRRKGKVDPEETAVYIVVLAMSIQTLATLYTMARDPECFCFVTSQIFKIGGESMSVFLVQIDCHHLKNCLDVGFWRDFWRYQ